METTTFKMNFQGKEYELKVFTIDIPLYGEMGIGDETADYVIEQSLLTNEYDKFCHIDETIDVFLGPDYDGDFSQESIIEYLEYHQLLDYDYGKSFNELSKDELWILRQSIVLNSLFYGDYETKYLFNPYKLESFFGGYVDYLCEIANDKSLPLSTIFSNYDNAYNLYEYFGLSDDWDIERFFFKRVKKN